MNTQPIVTKGTNYTIPQVDLSQKPAGVPEDYSYLYEPSVVDAGTGYLGHPDAVLLKNGDILTVYPKGHGRGAVLSKRSRDGGVTYGEGVRQSPASWEGSRETPTIYRLTFTQTHRPDKLILISGNPLWWDDTVPKTGGFNCSLSEDEGETWTEFQLFYPDIYTIVAMSSLTQLKENGHFVDKWMGLFHDADFHNYKTILTFDENGTMHWSQPQPYFAAHREMELGTNMCEVECVRSNGGQGDELCLITRSNTKTANSLLSFSTDEGETWSQPVEAPAALNGERHKADYLPDGRLVITFRSIERDPAKIERFKDAYPSNGQWISEGWIAWVGRYEDLKAGSEGQYRIKVAHTYLPGQNEPEEIANADCAYCGNVVLPDGTFVTMTYGIFTPDEKRHTYIVSKRIRLQDTDKLAENLRRQRK